MNGQMNIRRTYSPHVGRYNWGFEYTLDNGFSKSIGAPEVAVEAVEHALGTLLFDLTVGKYNGVNITVNLPEGITLTDAYKTQVSDKYTADGTIASITFE